MEYYILSRLLFLYTARWWGFLKAPMEVTLIGLLMIMRKGNLYHLMILSCNLTHVGNQSCKSWISIWSFVTSLYLIIVLVYVKFTPFFCLMMMLWFLYNTFTEYSQTWITVYPFLVIWAIVICGCKFNVFVFFISTIITWVISFFIFQLFLLFTIFFYASITVRYRFKLKQITC